MAIETDEEYLYWVQEPTVANGISYSVIHKGFTHPFVQPQELGSTALEASRRSYRISGLSIEQGVGFIIGYDTERGNVMTTVYQPHQDHSIRNIPDPGNEQVVGSITDVQRMGVQFMASPETGVYTIYPYWEQKWDTVPDELREYRIVFSGADGEIVALTAISS